MRREQIVGSAPYLKIYNHNTEDPKKWEIDEEDMDDINDIMQIYKDSDNQQFQQNKQDRIKKNEKNKNNNNNNTDEIQKNIFDKILYNRKPINQRKGLLIKDDFAKMGLTSNFLKKIGAREHTRDIAYTDVKIDEFLIDIGISSSVLFDDYEHNLLDIANRLNSKIREFDCAFKEVSNIMDIQVNDIKNLPSDKGFILSGSFYPETENDIVKTFADILNIIRIVGPKMNFLTSIDTKEELGFAMFEAAMICRDFENIPKEVQYKNNTYKDEREFGGIDISSFKWHRITYVFANDDNLYYHWERNYQRSWKYLEEQPINLNLSPTKNIISGNKTNIEDKKDGDENIAIKEITGITGTLSKIYLEVQMLDLTEKIYEKMKIFEKRVDIYLKRVEDKIIGNKVLEISYIIFKYLFNYFIGTNNEFFFKSNTIEWSPVNVFFSFIDRLFKIENRDKIEFNREMRINDPVCSDYLINALLLDDKPNLFTLKLEEIKSRKSLINIDNLPYDFFRRMEILNEKVNRRKQILVPYFYRFKENKK